MIESLVSELPDLLAREEALDTGSSILVQAPAGSGKTELLAMRFLKLLAEVEEPEQVLGITFTKAATAEIQHRILGKLEEARSYLETGIKPEGPETAAALAIATAALTNSIKRGWRLLEQPHRLNIETIDSLCLRISHQMPLSGKSGGTLLPTEAAAPLYKMAARQTFNRLGGGDEELSTALRALLLLRDSHLANCEDLLAQMLCTRDQWMRAFPLAGEIDWEATRVTLQEPFKREIERVLSATHAVFASHPALTAELLDLIRYACANPRSGEATSILSGLTGLPPPMAAYIDHWGAIRTLLLTQGGGVRSSFNAANGFPPEGKAERRRMKEVVAHLCAIPGFLAPLGELEKLPPARYTPEQWESLRHILVALRHAVRELNDVFAAQGEVDFIEIGIAALGVLNAEPGRGLALQHLLVDEFQDTSRTQHELVAALLREWSAEKDIDKERTIFLVGDPMQSIYMFRQADVELFELVKQSGFPTGAGRISPRPLALKTNFRSHAGVVEPLNEMFATIFPHGVKHASARVDFLPATPKDQARLDTAFQTHVKFRDSEDAGPSATSHHWETQGILSIINQHLPTIETAREQGKEFTVAVLARAKNHLVPVAAALREQGIPFRAVDLENLGERQEVLDLQSLTRALLHPMDRIAWLAMLRAPWCGLELRDLHLLCGTDERPSGVGPIAGQIEERLALLSDKPRSRVERLIAVLQAALVNRHKQSSFSSWIERTWTSLGGPACVDAAGYENARAYLHMLEGIAPDGVDAADDVMEDRLARLRAQSDPSVSERCGVQLMTMHKAKGLGFNVVVLPGLEKIVSFDPQPLLRYLERSTESGTELLVAPIGSKGEGSSPLYSWVRKQKENREAEERKRLLYVACTRARQELHLFVTVDVTNNGELRSRVGSLLQTAWPALVEDIQASFGERPLPAANRTADKIVEFSPSAMNSQPMNGVLDAVAAGSGASRLHRLPLDWTLQPTAANIAWPAPKAAALPTDNEIERRRPQGSRASRILGTTVHALFERAAKLFEDGLVGADLAAAMPQFRTLARALTRNDGLMPREGDSIAWEAVQALEQALADPIGLWILKSRGEAQTESSWTGVIDGAPRTLRIDRSFRAGPEPLREGKQCLWIIDYKTATHSPSGLERYLEAERRLYEGQLEKYGEIMRRVHGDDVDLRFGLYYPLLPRLVWWFKLAG